MSSRVGRKPIDVPAGVQISVSDQLVTIKGAKGELQQALPEQVLVKFEDNQIKVSPVEGISKGDAIAGTIRALLNNHVEGVTKGFSKKLQLVGVGYRAALGTSKDPKEKRPVLNLTLGFSHPVAFIVPEGVTVLCPTVTEIEVSGLDRQKVGQAAANIRGINKGLRKPEPYKGKGIRYSNEVIILKETKKK